MIASLLLMVAAGPTIALCAQLTETACCCSEDGCPKPSPRTVEPQSCCSADASTPIPAAIAPRAMPASAESFLAAPIVGAPATYHPARQLSGRDRHGGDSRSVSLFTLHAVLLI